MTKSIEAIARPGIFEIRPYVPGKPIEEVERELGLGRDQIIKLASNENPAGPSPLAVAAMQQAAMRTNRYPDSHCYELKQALAEHCRVPADHLVVGNGSDEVLKLIAEAFLQEGEEVVYGAPTFVEYEFVTRVMGGTPVEVPLKNFTYDLEAIAGEVNERTKLIFICNPNNPTGTIVTGTETERFLTRVPEDVLVVFDEAYREYVTDPAYPDTREYVINRNNVIILRTFSKIYALAGLRIGYGIASPEVIGCLMRVREPFNVNSMAQAAAAASLRDADYLEETCRVNLEGREYLYRELSALCLDFVPTQTNFIFIAMPRSGSEVVDGLMRMGVIVRPCRSFGYPDHIRVTIGTREQNQRFISALREVLGG
ncbi:MAG: histidinol-phosphate transaminase [Firmicutes bacterium]|nr:histidinol-phosphate transaminase [Bacillota bacterium]